MGDCNWKSYRSKEDQTQSISQSIFVTNFPGHVTARDIWKRRKPSAPSHPSNVNERNSPGGEQKVKGATSNEVNENVNSTSNMLEESVPKGKLLSNNSVCSKFTQALLEHDIVAAVKEFFALGTFPPGGNSSFIALILKIQDAKFVKDYRPISLIGSLYRTIAKILANRLNFVISGLISDVQSTFVFNRQILDDPFILSELISWCKHKKFKAMVFKVDFEKAFDSIRFIKAIYGEDGALNSPSSLSKHSPWLDIIREVTVLRSKGINLLDLIR
ncbi:RNA-directed DNA polymerase, eukaryota, reverse transcriptase zinc-binding domain protein [Tanacetum coccineum]